MTARDDERFLGEAVSRGYLTREQADDARRLVSALGEVEMSLSLDDILDRKGHLSRERSAELRRALARQRVGRYEVIERLGEGGSGVVWKARDTALDRIVALKLLARDARDDGRDASERRERFLREARTAVSLQHEGLVRGLDCGESDGHLWLAMEYVAGESVAARLRREGRIPESDAVRIALEVVAVLRYVASLGIVHRDLKPENLLLTPEGRVKVCDLGLAKPTREEAERLGAETVIAGTPLYLAPEQIRDGDCVDWRADVYSLGATLYHMLAGRPPFPYEKGKDLLERHLREVPPSPREFALDVTPNAAAVALKMLQKEPADRYARPEDLQEDLEAVLAGRAPLHTISFALKERATVDPAAARAAAAPDRPSGRTVAAVMGAVLLGLAALGLGFGALWRAESERRARAVASQPPDPEEGPETARPEPFPVPPAPEAPSPEEAEGRRALEAARKAAAAHRDDLRASRDAFQFVVVQHAGTAAAEIARGLVADLDREFERRAGVALAGAVRAAARDEAQGRFGAALAAFETVASEWTPSPAAKQATAEVRRLRAAADARLAELLDAVRDAVAVAQFDDARARLAEARALGLPWAEREVALRAHLLDGAEARFEDEREAKLPAFDRVWAQAVLLAGEKGVADALALLDAARVELAPWAREIDSLRIDLLSLPRASDTGPTATPLGLRGAFLARLSRRDLVGAAALLPTLQAAGADVAARREDLGRVRRLLTANADELLVLAERLRWERRLDEASRQVDKALAEMPGHPRARVAAAAILMDRERLDLAAETLLAVLAEPSPPPEAHLRLGQILAQRPDELEHAQREVELYLMLAPETDPFRAEGRAARETIVERLTEEKVAELRRSMKRSLAAGEREAALDDAQAIADLSPRDGRAWIDAGQTFAELGRPHDAYLAYRRVQDTEGGVGAWSQAQRLIRKLEQQHPTAPEALHAVAEARDLLAARDVEAARKAYDSILLRAPFLDDAIAGAAEAWLARKGSGQYAIRDDPRRALRLTQLLGLRSPQHVRGMELRAEALLRTGDAREALRLATEAVGQDPMRPDPATTAGFAALALGDPADALDRFRASLDRRHTPEAFYGRALSWERLGHRQSAIDETNLLLEEFGIPEEHREEIDGLLARLDLEYVPAEEEKAAEPPR